MNRYFEKSLRFFLILEKKKTVIPVNVLTFRKLVTDVLMFMVKICDQNQQQGSLACGLKISTLKIGGSLVDKSFIKSAKFSKNVREVDIFSLIKSLPVSRQVAKKQKTSPTSEYHMS